MAFYSANKPNRTLALHKDTCSHIPETHFPLVGAAKPQEVAINNGGVRSTLTLML